MRQRREIKRGSRRTRRPTVVKREDDADEEAMCGGRVASMPCTKQKLSEIEKTTDARGIKILGVPLLLSTAHAVCVPCVCMYHVRERVCMRFIK